MPSLKLLRHPTLWGAVALVLMLTVALVAAWLYVSPPGQKVVTFYTNDSATVHTGDPVRIAGIKVGKVSDLTLEADRIRVQARVDGDAFVGDQSQVDVRMLTVVGGYYVNITSLGDKPLGNNPIPVERVKMPYNLMQTLADSTKITEGLDAKPLRQTLDQLQNGLAGKNVKSLSAIVDAGNAVMSTIDKQRGQVSSILTFSDEYIQALNGYGNTLRAMVGKLAIIEETLVIYGDKFADGLQAFCNVLDAIAPIADFYDAHRDDLLEKFRNWEVKAQMWANNNGAVIRTMRAFRNKIERIVDAQNAPPQLLATDLCIPVPGSPC